MRRTKICLGKKNRKCFWVKRDRKGRIVKMQKINKCIKADSKIKAKKCPKGSGQGYRCDY